jgi:hypothetical protein
MTRATTALRQSRRSRKNDEHRLQVAVFQVIRLAGVPDLIAFAVPNGLVSNAISVSRMKAAGLLPGVADIAIVLPGGQACFLELKAGKGVQTPEQLAFQEACRANGTRYFVATGLDEAIDVLVEIGALRIDKVRGLRREPLREAAE